MELRDFKATSRRAGGSLLGFMKTADSDLSRTPSHLVPFWHSLGHLVFRQTVPKLSPFLANSWQRPTCVETLRASFPCALAGRRSSNRTLFSLAGSMTAVALFELSMQLLLLLSLCSGVPVGSLKSTWAGSIVTRVSERRELVKVIGGRIFFFLLFSVTTSCISRKCLHTTPVERWERALAPLSKALLLSERS